MEDYRKTFPKQHTFLVVVHVENVEQALRNVHVARQGGADGVFLINHAPTTPEQLMKIYKVVRAKFPKFWLGMNMLGLENYQAIHHMPEIETGLWSDNAGINEVSGAALADMFKQRRDWAHWKGIYFGGVAFKGQLPISKEKLASITKLATTYVDVITTSGSDTGFAPDIEKIKTMKEAIDDHPFAIASGMTPENVKDFMPYSDCFMVATGVSKNFTELDYTKVLKFKRALSS